MREPLEIINGIKNFISNNNPFRFPHQEEIMLNFLAELENTLYPPTAEEVVKETPVVEEPVVEEVIEEETPIVEEVVEEPVVEEVAVSTVKVKRPRKK
jgi:hypothetical protein